MRLAGLLRLAGRPMLVEQVSLLMGNTGTSVVPSVLLVLLLVFTLANSSNATALGL